MRPLLVVVLHPPRDPFPRRLERVEPGPVQELLPDAFPESLDLPERHRVVGTAPDVVHPVLLQFVLEPRLAAPVGVLPTVVRQHFLGHPVGPCRPPIHLQHVLCRHRPIESQPRDVPGMVIDEPDQVGELPRQPKREDVALPHLVRRGALEETRLRGIALRLGLHRRHQLLRVQRPPHRLRTRRHKEQPPEQLRDALHPEAGVRFLDRHNLRLHRRQRPVHTTARHPVIHRMQPRFAAFPVQPDPVEHRPFGDANLPRHQFRGNPFLEIEPHGLAPLLVRTPARVTNRSADSPLGGNHPLLPSINRCLLDLLLRLHW